QSVAKGCRRGCLLRGALRTTLGLLAPARRLDPAARGLRSEHDGRDRAERPRARCVSVEHRRGTLRTSQAEWPELTRLWICGGQVVECPGYILARDGEPTGDFHSQPSNRDVGFWVADGRQRNQANA